MTNEEILSKKRKGDTELVSEMIKESYDNTKQILRRPASKKHEKAIKALRAIIESRENVLNGAKTKETGESVLSGVNGIALLMVVIGIVGKMYLIIF